MVDSRRSSLAARLGENLMRGRKSLGLTQEQIAAMLSVEPETISRFERGATLPSIATLERLADILGTTMGVLLEEGEPRQFTDAEKLSALLSPISRLDRVFVVETVKRLCAHLQKLKSPIKKTPTKV